jgi:hypothetical protein
MSPEQPRPKQKRLAASAASRSISHLENLNQLPVPTATMASTAAVEAAGAMEPAG